MGQKKELSYLLVFSSFSFSFSFLIHRELFVVGRKKYKINKIEKKNKAFFIAHTNKQTDQLIEEDSKVFSLLNKQTHKHKSCFKLAKVRQEQRNSRCVRWLNNSS